MFHFDTEVQNAEQSRPTSSAEETDISLLVGSIVDHVNYSHTQNLFGRDYLM